jgi:hypothetical protein
MRGGVMTEHTTEILCTIIGAVPYDIASEASLQQGIEKQLTAAGVAFTREVRLTQYDRVDFLIGRLGIEVKTGGGKSPLLRQLRRYAQSDLVDGLLVVTTAPSLAALPASLNGKPIRALVLSACLV